jgi:ABC-type Fe3+-siderophore transport system permease subunit
MTPSIFIARILGPVLLIIGIGLLLEGDTFRTMAGEFVRDQGLIYITGILTLAAGLAILNVHHLWTRDWRVLITIFGWLFLIGGIMRILAMSMAQRVGESVIAHQRWPLAGAIVTLALGAFLTVMGYQDVWESSRRPPHRVSAARSTRPASRSAKRPRRKTGEARPPH